MSPPTTKPRARTGKGRDKSAFVWRGGVKVARVPLWFDAPRVVEPVVLSAVGAVSQLRSSRVVATPETFALREAIQHHGRAPQGALRVPYDRPFVLGNVRLELFSSGRCMGAACCLVVADSRKLVYAGALGPNDTLAAAPQEAREAEVVAVEARQASPSLRFPPRAGVWEALRSFVESALRDERTPVLLVPPLGMAQEVLRRLAEMPWAAHPGVARVCMACRRLGAPLPAVRSLGSGPKPGEVVLWPERVPLGEGLPAREQIRVGLVSASCLQPGTAAFGADEAFPLASLADFETLVGFLRKSKAREVALIRWADPALVQALSDMGVKVRVVGPPAQMSLFDG